LRERFFFAAVVFADWLKQSLITVEAFPGKELSSHALMDGQVGKTAQKNPGLRRIPGFYEKGD